MYCAQTSWLIESTHHQHIAIVEIFCNLIRNLAVYSHTAKRLSSSLALEYRYVTPVHFWTGNLLRNHWAIPALVCTGTYCRYGVATISRLLKIKGLFCKKTLSKRRYSVKEIYDFKGPTNRSHPICDPRALLRGQLIAQLLDDPVLFCRGNIFAQEFRSVTTFYYTGCEVAFWRKETWCWLMQKDTCIWYEKRSDMKRDLNISERRRVCINRDLYMHSMRTKRTFMYSWKKSNL